MKPAEPGKKAVWTRPGDGAAGWARRGDLEIPAAQAQLAALLWERWRLWVPLALLGLAGAALMVLGGQELRTAAGWLAYGLGGAIILALVGKAVPAPAEFFTGVRQVLGPLTLLSGLLTLTQLMSTPPILISIDFKWRIAQQLEVPFSERG